MRERDPSSILKRCSNFVAALESSKREMNNKKKRKQTSIRDIKEPQKPSLITNKSKVIISADGKTAATLKVTQLEENNLLFTKS